MKTLSRSMPATLLLGFAFSLVCASNAWSQEAQPATADADKKQAENAPTELDEIALEQGQLADKYRRLEELIFKMADFEAAANPRRSALLRQAYKQSKDRLTASQLATISRLLNQQQFKRALDGQDAVQKDLAELLQLLLTEAQTDRNKTDQARYREYIRQVERLLRQQRTLQGQNEGGADPKRLAPDQGKVAKSTGDLADQIRENEEGGASGEPGEGEPGEGEPGEGKPGEGKPGEGKPGEGEPGEGEPGEGEPGEGEPGEGEPGEGEPGEGKPGEGKPGEGKPGEGKPGEGKPGEGEPGEGQGGESQGEQQQDDGNSARKRLEEAEQKMKDAQQALEDARRDDALEAQEEAKQKLVEAKAQLEEILRQLREEELERMLALLEGRFRRMLEMEIKVYEGTLRISQIAKDDRGRESEIEAGKLSSQQRRIVLEADKVLNLLREEGSSVAFPETVDQMREDMEQVGHRLGQTKVDRLTQSIEEDIIQTLEELIEALQKAQQELEEQQQQQQQQEQQQQQDQPLVDELAELKMIRSLQMRVNGRTKRYARLLDDIDDLKGQASDTDLLQALQRLSDREQRIYRITREIVLGRNK